jgi:hypothetical protein
MKIQSDADLRQMFGLSQVELGDEDFPSNRLKPVFRPIGQLTS